MFEIKRSEGLKVKIYDVEYALKKPSVKMIEEYAIDLEQAPTSEKFARAKFLLVGMGLPQSVVDEMEFEHLQQLIEFLTGAMTSGSKKN